MPRASESTHWYKQDGTPLYEVPKKTGGGMRNTTLRDARKLNLVPSVTTIIDIAAKPGLVAWKINQILLAALTLEQKGSEGLDAFAKRVQIDAGEHARVARETGTAIHASLEAYFSHDFPDADHIKHCAGAEAALIGTFGRQEWSAEKSFASPLGFGGKVDLNCPSVVADFKTKEFGPEAKAKDFAYPEMAMQLAAYRKGLGLNDAVLANVFVSVTHPGLTLVHIWEEGSWLERFLHLLDYWRLTKNFDPAF
jgi:hypothetical protein